MESYEILWNNSLVDLQNTVQMTGYNTFISQITPVDLIENKIILWSQTTLTADRILMSYSSQIKSALNKASSGAVNDFEIVVGKNKETALKQATREPSQQEFSGSPINPKFTFDSFVVGGCNEFTVAAAKSVAMTPGDTYNPLFIYGNTGLGKTHVLMAIANYVKLHNPTVNVLYTTCEQFTNQLIDAISRGKNNGQKFRNTFRNVDVLLIDDIQFLSGKQQTQSEFFHTFNELIAQNKQIVITSDRPPAEIDVLEERLRTRFEGGLLADVQKPDLETRIAILKKKSEERRVVIDIKVLSHIAQIGGDDIRSLIGQLTRVVFASQLHEKPITVELVDEALKESVADNSEEIQADDIIDCVAEFYKIKSTDIIGKKRNKEFVEPRQICMYLIAELMNLPLVTIGQKLGGRDYSTVIYGRDKIADHVKDNNKLATEINDIKNMILKK